MNRYISKSYTKNKNPIDRQQETIKTTTNRALRAMHLKPLTWKLADFVGKSADKVHTCTSYFDLLYTVNNFVIPRAGKQYGSGHGEGKF